MESWEREEKIEEVYFGGEFFNGGKTREDRGKKRKLFPRDRNYCSSATHNFGLHYHGISFNYVTRHPDSRDRKAELRLQSASSARKPEWGILNEKEMLKHFLD